MPYLYKQKVPLVKNGDVITGNDGLKYKVINIGLPHVYIFDRNVGATDVSDPGLYFAWAETEGCPFNELGTTRKFSREEYKFLGDYSTSGEYSKYNSTDNIWRIQAEDNAVKIHIGEEFTMLSSYDYNEFYQLAAWDANYTYQDGSDTVQLYSFQNNFDPLPFVKGSIDYLNGKFSTDGEPSDDSHSSTGKSYVPWKTWIDAGYRGNTKTNSPVNGWMLAGDSTTEADATQDWTTGKKNCNVYRNVSPRYAGMPIRGVYKII